MALQKGNHKERGWKEPFVATVFKQHWVRSFKGEKLDVYTLNEHSIQLLITKWLGYKDEAIDISYDRIDSVKYQSSLLGWLLGYGTVIIDVGDDKYILEDVISYKKFYNKLTAKINAVKNHRSY